MTWYRTITLRDITLPLRVELENFGFGYNWIVTVDSGSYAGMTHTHYSTSTRAYQMDIALEKAANEITYAITQERITIEEYEEAITPTKPDEPPIIDPIIDDKSLDPDEPPIIDPIIDNKSLDISILIIAVMIIVIIIGMWLS